MPTGFAITQGKGIGITLNGWVLSVQFGPYNYCSNYYTKNNGTFDDEAVAKWTKHEKEGYYPDHKSSDAEIALWREGREMLTLCGDSVAGRVSPIQVARILAVLAEEHQTQEQALDKVRKILS